MATKKQKAQTPTRGTTPARRPVRGRPPADLADRERARVDGIRRLHFALLLQAARDLVGAVADVRERKRHLLGLLDLSVSTEWARQWPGDTSALEARFDPELAAPAQRIAATLESTDALTDLERGARALSRVPALRLGAAGAPKDQDLVLAALVDQLRAASTPKEQDVLIAALVDQGMPIKAAVRVAVTPGKPEAERDRFETAKFEAALQRTKRTRRATERAEQEIAARAARLANASPLFQALGAPSRREDEILRAIAGTDLLPR